MTGNQTGLPEYSDCRRVIWGQPDLLMLNVCLFYLWSNQHISVTTIRALEDMQLGLLGFVFFLQYSKENRIMNYSCAINCMPITWLTVAILYKIYILSKSLILCLMCIPLSLSHTLIILKREILNIVHLWKCFRLFKSETARWQNK